MELLGRELGTHWADFGIVEPNPNRTMPWSGRRLLSDRPTARRLRSYLMNQGALCSTFRQLLDVDIREVNAQHLASVGPQPDDQLHPADLVDNKETTVVASDREPNRPAQVNGRCRPLACQTRCSPTARKRSAGEPIGCQT